ncbi:MAG: hypothetical protein IPI69_04720 [Bacteroidales bacterium]|nr:hypothetical protein [Bacteroidales bacterium]
MRAYATNSVGTAYGNEIDFTTTALAGATVTTNEVTVFSYTTATAGGNVTATGGDAVTARGVCYGTTANPTISGTHTEDGTGIGAFTSNLTGLTSGTKYYVRAYATNSTGTEYGAQVEFTTLAVTEPAVSTGAVSSITDVAPRLAEMSLPLMVGQLPKEVSAGVLLRILLLTTSLLKLSLEMMVPEHSRQI